MMSVTMRFCGAAGAVTGSCYWIRTPDCQFLIDCGLFQGPKTVKELNYRPFPFDPSKIDFVLQTHAHIDHAGLLPKLCKADFKGRIFATEGTRDLLSFMLPDSGHIQEMEVRQLNFRNARHGKPAVTPIYTRRDAEDSLDAIETVEYEEWIEAGTGIRARFWNAGHILGSASIEVEITSSEKGQQSVRRLLFSGDIGPDNKLFHPDPEAPNDFDYVVCESTYGGRERERTTPEERRKVLAQEVNQALQRDGTLLIPIFAVERTQELMTDLLALQVSGELPGTPVFLDSPLAIRVTRVFEKHAHDLEELSEQPNLLDNPFVYPTETSDESKQIDRVSGGAVILAASGMCDAGRVRHHLKRLLWNKKTTVLFVGYQAPGTLGRLLVDGAKLVKIQGNEIRVQAKIRQINSYSGHADGEELVQWIQERQPVKCALFLTHGEREAIDALTTDLVEQGMDAKRIFGPSLDDEVELSGDCRLPEFREVSRRLPAEAIMDRDWHNDLTQFWFDVRDALEQAADEKSRAKVLRRLRRALEDQA
jgi:metallo-beta-lactamase family protein